MIVNIKRDLFSLFQKQNIVLHPSYQRIMEEQLVEGLAYTTPLMVGLIDTLLSNLRMMAYNLLQNAIDEAKGAARVHLIAERYAAGPLRQEMLRHAGDEMRHSRQFAEMIVHTGYEYEDTSDTEETARTAEGVLTFDDDLYAFICRVHSIEIRSWVMLRHYLRILGKYPNENIRAMIPAFEQILSDEVRHVFYTGKWVNRWLHEKPELASTLMECVVHTNRETWHDVASMANYMATADIHAEGFSKAPANLTAGRWDRAAQT